VRPKFDTDAIQPRRSGAYDATWQGRAPAVVDATAIILNGRPLFVHQAERDAEIRIDQADMPPALLSCKLGIDERRLLPADPWPPVDHLTRLMQRTYPATSNWKLDARDAEIVQMSATPSVANVQHVIMLPGSVEQQARLSALQANAKDGYATVLQRRYGGFHSSFNMATDGIDAQLVLGSRRQPSGGLHVTPRDVRG
jgi:hypothetical protein